MSSLFHSGVQECRGAETPFSLSSAETVRQRCSTSVFRLYALRPNSESRPLSSCSRETRSTPTLGCDLG